MLVQFSFKNFKSFRDDAILDMTATKITEHGYHVISAGGDKLLPVACIYGANASGKSNVYEAFKYMAAYVVESFSYGGESSSRRETTYARPTPFLFDSASKEDASAFEVYFIDDSETGSGKSYNYGFCVDAEGVVEEWLNTKAKTGRKYTPVFYRSRSEHELDLSGLPKSVRDNIEIALEDEVLIVSLGAKLKVAKLKMIRDFFQNVWFADYGNPVENLIRSRTLPRKFVENEHVQQSVLDYFATFDDNIKGFEIERVTNENDSEREPQVSINAIHKMIGESAFAKIPLTEESAGTLKMFSLFPSLMEALKTGGVLFIDELNARLHPLLVRNFILSFVDPDINIHHAQLIFTAHDTWQMSNDLLRRDEIWFADKDHDGVSRLYSLVDFVDADGDKIRKDENYAKNYLIGKYGAIPALKSIRFLED